MDAIPGNVHSSQHHGGVDYGGRVMVRLSDYGTVTLHGISDPFPMTLTDPVVYHYNTPSMDGMCCVYDNIEVIDL